MASLGMWNGIYDGTGVGDPYGNKQALNKGGGRFVKFHGVLAFLQWRSAYWGKQVSWSNKLLIPMLWFKTLLFGRDVSRF